jgi:nitrogen-specific signal transduction histidine kinase
MADVGDRKRLEAQYRQAQKMEAVGQLAGGVAHDFNNMLTIMLGYAEMLEGQLADREAAELLREIGRAGQRAAAITRQLLAFSRKQVLDPRVVSLNAIVLDMEKMLGRLIGEDVALTTALEPELWQVRVDPGQIEQVIMNLAVNARDAMPQGGRLTLETANVTLDTSYARTHPYVQPGNYALLAMTDTGCGMDEATRARVFEPFFTTKEKGKGTGLGMATVYGIIKQSGGHIEVYSEPAHGTTLKVYLPAIAEAAAPDGSARAPAAACRGTETVLLVEDEEALRILARQVLKSHGYEVLEAIHGDEAMRVADAHSGPIHILVTDVVMPLIGGRQLAERLRSVRPQTKVLFMSGYTDDAIVRHGILEAQAEFLQKPFTPSALARKVREVLDR